VAEEEEEVANVTDRLLGKLCGPSGNEVKVSRRRRLREKKADVNSFLKLFRDLHHLTVDWPLSPCLYLMKRLWLLNSSTGRFVFMMVNSRILLSLF
jgi:hypothetical protein